MRETAGGLALWYASFRYTHDFSVAYIGVPFNVLIACAIGTFCAFSFHDTSDKLPRSKMAALFIASMMMGAAFTSITNGVLQHFELQMTVGLHAGLGAAVSFITRFFLPWLREVVRHGKWVKWVPFLNKGGNDG